LLSNLVVRARDENLHLSHNTDSFLTQTQAMQRLAFRRLAHEDVSLKLLSKTGELRRLAAIPSYVDRMVAALATKKLSKLPIIARRLKMSV